MERSWIKNRNIPHSGSWQPALGPLPVSGPVVLDCPKTGRNAGITESPLACRAQPHIGSGFPKTTLKRSVSAKCGLSDGTFTDFYTGWSQKTQQPSINQKWCLFCMFLPKCWSQSKHDHEWPKCAKAMKK